MAVQTDGKILLGGSFDVLGGYPRARIARLNTDGTLDLTFNPGTGGNIESSVQCLAVQPDGRVLVGGWFTALAGQSRRCLGRLSNTDPITHRLTYDGATITWQRGGPGSELWRTAFDVKTNGTDWLSLGAGSRIPGGWQWSGVPIAGNPILRARGFVTAGNWFVESWYPQVQPALLVNDGNFGIRSNHFGFDLSGTPGQSIILEASTDLLGWMPLSTNTLGTAPLYFSDPTFINFSSRFYRARSE
jgi:hypothetical protein